MKFYYVYMLECSDNSFYVGFSSTIEKRLDEHHSGKYKDAYTYSRRPVVLKWLGTFNSAEQAIAFEKQLKGWSRRKKIALINEDWDKLVEYSRNYTQFGSSGLRQAQTDMLGVSSEGSSMLRQVQQNGSDRQ